MKFEETITSKCRYATLLLDVFNFIDNDFDVLWENSKFEYQGHVKILIETKNKNVKWIYYEYSYGSCIGCDTWQSAGMTYNEIKSEMKRNLSKFKEKNKSAFLKFLKMKKINLEIKGL